MSQACDPKAFQAAESQELEFRLSRLSRLQAAGLGNGVSGWLPGHGALFLCRRGLPEMSALSAGIRRKAIHAFMEQERVRLSSLLRALCCNDPLDSPP